MSKTRKHKFIPLIICLLLMTGIFCVLSLDSKSTGSAYDGKSTLEQHDGQYEMNARSLICGLEEMKSDVIRLDSMMPEDEAKSFGYEVYAKYPEISLCYSPKLVMTGYSSDSKYCIGFRVKYLSEDGGLMRCEELAAATEPFMQEIRELPDRDKIEETVGWIKSSCTYTKKPRELWGGSLYGCLVKGEATCLGYSEAFFYIMDSLGVPCRIECSKYHAWNVVYDGREWIKVDLTQQQPILQAD